MITVEQLSKFYFKKKRKPWLQIYYGLVSKDSTISPDLINEGGFNAYVIDPRKRGTTPLRDILTGKSTDCLIEKVLTDDINQVFQFFDKYYYL